MNKMSISSKVKETRRIRINKDTTSQPYSYSCQFSQSATLKRLSALKRLSETLPGFSVLQALVEEGCVGQAGPGDALNCH